MEWPLVGNGAAVNLQGRMRCKVFKNSISLFVLIADHRSIVVVIERNYSPQAKMPVQALLRYNVCAKDQSSRKRAIHQTLSE